MSFISNKNTSTKRFDFVVKTDNYIYGIETNFYASGGSKLNETARSYKMIAEEADKVVGFEFVWFTDGMGWISARNNLRETFDSMDNIYNINDMKNGVMGEIFKQDQGANMKEIIKKVFSFIKSLFNNDFKTNINNNKVNDIKKNRNCNINIINNGAIENDRK